MFVLDDDPVTLETCRALGAVDPKAGDCFELSVPGMLAWVIDELLKTAHYRAGCLADYPGNTGALVVGRRGIEPI